MIPTDNGSTQPCSPISSNCVVWQGPDIPCIDICNGDTVSDVVANLATEVCNLIDAACECNPVLSIDASCLTIADPTNLDQVIQAIIDQICLEKEEVEVKYTLPKCLIYDDNLGNPVTALPLDDFLTLLGNNICTLITSINVLEQNFLNLQSRVAVLEECVLPCDESGPSDFFVISSCIQPGQSIPISTLVLALESEFCTFRDVVGNVGLLNTAINAQCLFASSPQLSQEGTLGNLTGWVNSPSTLAESNVNQWLAICDLHRAVADIQNNCCDELCSGIDVQYAYTIIEGGTGIPESINLNFSASTVPAGYNDCSGGSTVTITDSNGTSISQAISIAGLSNDPTGINIPLAGLNVFQTLVVKVSSCLSNDSSQCRDTSSINVPLNIPCPTNVTVTSGSNVVNVSFINGLGTGVTYEIQAYESGNPSSILGTTVITNPGVTVSHVFPGALPSTDYTVVISVSQGGITRICDTVEVSVPGVVCTSVETIATTVSPSIDDIFLGYEGDLSAGTATRYSFNVSSNEIVIESLIGGPGFCYSPILSGLSMNTVSGEVSLTADWGDAAETAIDLSYSTDDITYSAPSTGVDGARTLATGILTGSVYVQAVTDCGGGSESLPTKWRYDFSTDTWQMIQSPSECIDSDLTIDMCPAGVQVAQQFLECGDTIYSTPGAPATSYWYYIRKTVVGGVTRYLYAGWDQSLGVRKVVQCCVCPAFILTDIIRVFAGQEAGYVTNITLPYVLGDGNPQINIITNPVGGTLTQDPTTTNEFTYTTIEKVEKNYGDTFQVQISPTISGECTSLTVTVQIQIVSCGTNLKHTNSDIYAFVNTGGYSSAEGILLKAGLTALGSQWNTDFGFTGNIYFIPTPDSRWLGYQKSIVDDGASWSQDPDPAWQALEDLPTSWSGGASVFKNSAFIMVFSNDSDGTYHDSTLAAGFGGAVTQPSTGYKEDYDAYEDSLTGSATSAWAIALGISAPQFPDGLTHVLCPLTVPNSTGADAANILQMIAATTAELIPPSKYGIKTAVNVGEVIQGIGSSNPYSGATTLGGNTIDDLFEFNIDSGTLALLDQDKTSNYILDIGNGVNEEFNSILTTSLKGCDDAYPTTPISASNVYEVEKCGTSFVYYVTITGESCGTIPNGTVVRLENNAGVFAPGDGRDDWDAAQNFCVTILDNCSGVAVEVTTDLTSTHTSCAGCP